MQSEDLKEGTPVFYWQTIKEDKEPAFLNPILSFVTIGPHPSMEGSCGIFHYEGWVDIEDLKPVTDETIDEALLYGIDRQGMIDTGLLSKYQEAFVRQLMASECMDLEHGIDELDVFVEPGNTYEPGQPTALESLYYLFLAFSEFANKWPLSDKTMREYMRAATFLAKNGVLKVTHIEGNNVCFSGPSEYKQAIGWADGADATEFLNSIK